VDPWRIQTRLRGVTLGSLACRSKTQCFAVGRSDAGVARLAEWSGTRWRLVTIPLPTANSSLDGVSCHGGSCLAVGSAGHQDRLDSRPFAEAFDGHTWMPVSPSRTTRPSAPAELTLVTCPATRACIAVGSLNPGDPRYGARPFSESWNGSRWQVRKMPDLAQAAGLDSGFSGLACENTTSCWAVGAEAARGNGSKSVSEHWNGRTWAIIPVPVPSRFSSLSGISCSSTQCTAVGEEDYEPLIEKLHEYRWKPVAEKQIFAPSGTDLSSVWCQRTSPCLAVGEIASNTDDDIGGGTSEPLTLARGGQGRWTLKRSPRFVASTQPGFSDVVCLQNGRCLASGNLIPNTDALVSYATFFGEFTNASAASCTPISVRSRTERGLCSPAIHFVVPGRTGSDIH
jgi:hypothetical protein